MRAAGSAIPSSNPPNRTIASPLAPPLLPPEEGRPSELEPNSPADIVHVVHARPDRTDCRSQRELAGPRRAPRRAQLLRALTEPHLQATAKTWRHIEQNPTQRRHNERQSKDRHTEVNLRGFGAELPSRAARWNKIIAYPDTHATVGQGEGHKFDWRKEPYSA
jgi:hypothetical protein